MPDAKQNPENKKDSKDKFPGYPLYPESEDIYSRAKEETEIDPEHLNRKKIPLEDPEAPNENNFRDKTGGDLDVPGSELDDAQEDIGSEDEENNYYSLGGDKEQ